MNDLISRKALIAEYDRVHVGPPGGARKLMVDAPAVDAVEVVHGRWIVDDSGVIICSECGAEHEWQDYRASFCEDCGAKMDGERKDDE